MHPHTVPRLCFSPPLLHLNEVDFMHVLSAPTLLFKGHKLIAQAPGHLVDMFGVLKGNKCVAVVYKVLVGKVKQGSKRGRKGTDVLYSAQVSTL